MNVVGYISIYASTNYGATLILVAAISIRDGFIPYDASPTGWVSTKYSSYGIFVATIILTLFMTNVSSGTLAKLNTAYIYLQFAIVLATIIALAAATPSSFKNSASFVFSDFENTGFWINNGWTFMLCFLTSNLASGTSAIFSLTSAQYTALPGGPLSSPYLYSPSTPTQMLRK